MLAARRVGRTGIVHAIDASPTVFAMLRENLARNGIDNAVAHNVAVSDRDGTVTVYLHDETNLGQTTIVESEASSGGHGRHETIAARPLTEIVPRADLRRAKIIKIDVEGAEWPIVRSLGPLLPELRDDVTIVVEVNRRVLASHGMSIAGFLAFFDAHGFGALRLPDHDAALCIGGNVPPPRPVEPAFEMADLIFRRHATV